MVTGSERVNETVKNLSIELRQKQTFLGKSGFFPICGKLLR